MDEEGKRNCKRCCENRIDNARTTEFTVCIKCYGEVVTELEALESKLAEYRKTFKVARDTILALRTVVMLGHSNPQVIDWASAERECEITLAELRRLES